MTTFLQVSTLTTLIGNPNRDRSGRPKELTFGGVRRHRMSSQSLKRAWRHGPSFREAVEAEQIGVLTRNLPSIVAQQLDPAKVDDEGRMAIMEAVSRIGTVARGDAEGDDADDAEDLLEEGAEGVVAPKTRQAMFFTVGEARIIAERLTAALQDRGLAAFKKLDQKAILSVLGDISGAHGVWTALFGRMTTASPLKDIDAAVSLTHAFGVHRLELEHDFFTGVDDLEEGAAFLDSAGTPFAGTTFYHYYTVDMGRLAANLGGSMVEAVKVARALLHGSLTTVPGGMEHRFAHYSRPHIVLAEVVKGQPVSYANAFLQPVRASVERSQYVAARDAMLDFIGEEVAMWGQDTRRAYLAPQPLSEGRLRFNDKEPNSPPAFHCPRLDTLLAWVERELTEA